MKEQIGREAEIIRNRRIELGMSKMEVALSAGLVLQQYQRFEYGYQKLSNANMITALRICSVLQLTHISLLRIFSVYTILTTEPMKILHSCTSYVMLLTSDYYGNIAIGGRSARNTY